MSFSYRNYVTRYKYEPFSWPPDLGLSQLHARCSEPGPINENGVQCPCCRNWSKKKVKHWWKRNINDDTQKSGTAVPGYFQLLKYYSCFALLVMLINSLYPINATYHACKDLDDIAQPLCLEVGALYYLQFNDLISLLSKNHEQQIIDVLLGLQTAVFYVLLFANYFSIIFMTFLNETSRHQFSELKNSESICCLVFCNLPKTISQNLHSLLNEQGEYTMKIIKSMELYEIKKYYEYFNKRNKVYYDLLSLEVIGENPLKYNKKNKILSTLHQGVVQEKQKMNKFSGKVVVMLENLQSRRQIHNIYKINYLKKWWYGCRSLLKQCKIYDFDESSIKMSTYQLGLESDIIWQNIGEQLGTKMATRIKSFGVAVLFIFICYIILYYPMIFSLKTHIKSQTDQFVQLSTFEKILPNITSFALVALSLYFRVYMDRLSEERNPKDHLSRARFLLITCLTFHILFYVLIPTIFFLYPGQISGTVKLYVISEQARTFIVVQVIIVLIDLPYRIWRRKKIRSLSDQRIAFKNNQQMLHKIVECRDYPLQIRLQVLFRIWSLVLFYSFFIPYMMFYILVAFVIIFWIEKRNLYKHYAIKRRVSIKLESQVIMYYVNFFCIYLCFIYCYTVHNNTIKILFAVISTIVGLSINIFYWIIMSKGDEKSHQIVVENGPDLSKETAFLKKQNLVQKIQQFAQKYQTFLSSIQNDQLDQEVTMYIKNWKQYTNQKETKKNKLIIELQNFNESKSEQVSESIEETDNQIQDDQINENNEHL